MSITRRAGPAAGALLALSLLGACRQDMHDQPRYEPLVASDFFPDQRASRPAVAGTIARGHLHDDTLLWTGKIGNDFSPVFPFAVTEQVMHRGRERFDIFCSPCHDHVGTGRGMVVLRGFPQAASFHDERLVKAQPGYFFDVMTNGFGRMPSYAAQIPVKDRWAIAAYVRALQRSQRATIADVPADKRPDLEARRK